MNYKMVGRFLAQILTVEGLFMIPAVIIGYVCGEDNAMQALLWSSDHCSGGCVFKAYLQACGKWILRKRRFGVRRTWMDRYVIIWWTSILYRSRDSELCGCII